MPTSPPLPDVPTVQLVLASASPRASLDPPRSGDRARRPRERRRRGLTVAEATDRYGLLGPGDIALLLARAKAEDVASRLDDHAVVLGCDSVLELDGEVHGQAGDAGEAVARWRRMRGRSGVLHTGHWLIDERKRRRGHPRRDGVETVHFAEISDEEISTRTSHGRTAHGGRRFTIDGLGGAFITAVEGDHHNVVGLSLPFCASCSPTPASSGFRRRGVRAAPAPTAADGGRRGFRGRGRR